MRPRRLTILVVIAVVAAAFLLPAVAAFASTGWAGYAWSGNTYASTQLTVPRTSGPNGSVALWAGLGKGDPGIQQTGVNITESSGHESVTAWWELWPAPAHAFSRAPAPGDHVVFIVSRSGTSYDLVIRDVTQGWQENARETDPHIEGQGEAIAEGTGPGLPGFAASFYGTSGPLSTFYDFPGATVTVTGNRAFTVRNS